MTKINFILVNGPPSSGKSTFARELSRELTALGFKVVTDSFAAPMKHFISAALGERYDVLNKGRPMPELNGYSIRELFIDLAQKYIKQRYGNDVFAKWLVHRHLKKPFDMPHFVIVDDLGFPEELTPIVNSRIIQIHRPGTSWSDDSRSYIGPAWGMLLNQGTLIDLFINTKSTAQGIYDEVTNGKAPTTPDA